MLPLRPSSAPLQFWNLESPVNASGFPRVGFLSLLGLLAWINLCPEAKQVLTLYGLSGRIIQYL